MSKPMEWTFPGDPARLTSRMCLAAQRLDLPFAMIMEFVCAVALTLGLCQIEREEQLVFTTLKPGLSIQQPTRARSGLSVQVADCLPQLKRQELNFWHWLVSSAAGIPQAGNRKRPHYPTHPSHLFPSVQSRTISVRRLIQSGSSFLTPGSSIHSRSPKEVSKLHQYRYCSTEYVLSVISG